MANYPITTWVITSSIPSHPCSAIIEKTLHSLGTHLPGVEIIISCDGLKPSHDYRKEAYEIYKSVLPGKVIEHQDHVHQSGMILQALPEVTTPLMLVLEHDWEILHPIEWGAISDFILSGEANYVKLHAGNRIHPLHEHMMRERVQYKDSHFIRTVQFSANPFICSTEWMRSLTPFFEGKCDFIENLLHGPIATSPWEQYKLTIYNPITGDMRRVIHLDGRAGEPNE